MEVPPQPSNLRRASQGHPRQRYSRASYVRPLRPSLQPSIRQGGRALVLVNMQVDFFCDVDAAKLPIGGATSGLVEACNRLRDAVNWDVVVLTREWFPSNHISFQSNNPGLADAKAKDSLHALKPDHCIVGSDGAQFHPLLKRHFQDFLISTGTNPASFSWGCSDDPVNRKNTLLTEFLKDKHIQHMVVAGVGMEGKIKQTVLQTFDIVRHEWRMEQDEMTINIVHDACAANNDEDGVAAIDECRKHGIDVVSVKDVESLGKHSSPPSEHDQLLEEIVAAASQTTACDMDDVHAKLTALHALAPPAHVPRRPVQDGDMRECGPLRTGRFLLHALCEIHTVNAVRIANHMLDNMLASVASEAVGTGETPLHVACQTGNGRMVAMLLNNNKQSYALRQAELRRADVHKMSALLYALQSRSWACVSELGRADGDQFRDLLGCRDKHNRNALMIALEAQSESEEGRTIFSKLRNSFPDKQWKHEQVDRAGWCVWHYAVKHGATNELREQLDLGKQMPERKTDNGTNATWMKYRMDTAPLQDMSRLDQLTGPVFAKTAKKVSMLHLAVSCEAFAILPDLVRLFKAFNKHNNPMSNGLNALDVALEAVDPTVAFELVKGGCLPLYYNRSDSVHSTKVLLYKALFLGEASVIRILLTEHGHNVTLDRHLLNLGIHQKHLNLCSNHFPYRTENLSQPWYSVAGLNHAPVCTTCALRCHAAVGRSVVFQGLRPGRCACATLVIDEEPVECQCQVKVEPDNNTHINVVKVPPVLVQRKHIKSLKVQVRGNKLGKKFGQDLQDLDAGNLVSGTALVPRQSEDMHSDFVIKVFLLSAASYGQEPEVRELVRMVNDVEFNDLDESEETPLHAAVRFNHTRVCRILASCTTSKLVVPNAAGATYLTLAAAFGHYEICKIVGTDENLFKMDSLGLTPIHHAVRNNHVEVVRLLARRVQTSKRRIARNKGDQAIDEVFLQEGLLAIPTNQLESRPPGLPTLRSAQAMEPQAPVSNIDCDEVRTDLANEEPGSLEAHANPLHLAVRYGHVECVEELLRAGASPSHKDRTGFAPYKTALWCDYKARELVELRKREAPSDTKRRRLGGLQPAPPKAIGDLGHSQGSGGSAPHRRPRATPMSQSMAVVDSTIKADETTHILRVMVKDRTIKRLRRRFAFKRFYQEMLLPLAVAFAFLILTVPKSSATFLAHRWIQTSLDANTLEGMTDFSDVWGWIDTRMLNTSTLLPATYDPEQSLSGLSILGPMRVRQQRSRNTTEALPITNEPLLVVSLPRGYSHDNEDANAFPDDAFDAFTALPECSGVFDRDANNPWVYTPADIDRKDSNSFGSYDTGGYVVSLFEDEAALNQKRLDCLRQTQWVDGLTRAVVVDVSVFNMNMGTFTAVRLLVTVGLTGKLDVKFSDRSSTLGWGLHDKLEGSLESFDYPSTAMEGVAFVELCGALLAVLTRSLNRYRQSPRRGVWAGVRSVVVMANLYDALLAALLLTLIVYDFVAKRMRREEFPESFSADQTRFVRLFDLLSWVADETSVLAFVTLMVWLRVLVHTLLLPVVGPLVYAIFFTIQTTRVLTFLGLLLYMMVGFLFAFRIVLAQIFQCRSYFATIVLLVQLMIEEWNADVYAQVADGTVGPMLLIVMMLLVALVYMNLFISVLAVVYPKEKERAEKQYDDIITQATQEEYKKRANPLLSVGEHSSRLVKFLRTALLRPAMERVAEIIDLVRPDHQRQVLPFGWSKPAMGAPPLAKEPEEQTS